MAAIVQTWESIVIFLSSIKATPKRAAT